MKKALVFLLVACMTIASFSYSLLAADDMEVYSPAATTAQLQYSTVVSWDPSTMEKYNCYAYAIGRTSQAHDPGDFSNGAYDPKGEIKDLANLVKADLLGGLGYVCVKITSTRPEYDPGWVNIIAVRKDTNAPYEANDYHVAKLTSSGWYHKPGKTAILKFNNPPSNSVPWIGEGYKGYFVSNNTTYDSQLRYLLYKMYHSATLSQVWTEEHYHSGAKHYYKYKNVCQDCGDDEGTTFWRSFPCSGDCVTPWGTEIDSEIS